MEAVIEYRLSENKETLHHSPSGGGVRVQMSAIQKEQSKDFETLDTEQSEALATFRGNYETWNALNAMSSSSNFDNAYFKEIVNMGKKAVPFIYEELKKIDKTVVFDLFENMMKK